MSLKIHFIVSTILGLILGFVFKSFAIGILSWLIGWLIDCDHLLDYFLYLLKFKKKPEIEEFFSGFFFRKLGKVYLLGHAWEYLFLFLVVGFYKLSFPFALAIFLSYGLHLFLDQFANNGHPAMYFLFYRIKVGFKTNKLCQDKYGEGNKRS